MVSRSHTDTLVGNYNSYPDITEVSKYSIQSVTLLCYFVGLSFAQIKTLVRKACHEGILVILPPVMFQSRSRFTASKIFAFLSNVWTLWQILCRESISIPSQLDYIHVFTADVSKAEMLTLSINSREVVDHLNAQIFIHYFNICLGFKIISESSKSRSTIRTQLQPYIQ